MRRTNRDRPPAVRPKLAFEPLEPRELLAADVDLDWWSTDPAADSGPTDDWVWAFDDGWTTDTAIGMPWDDAWWIGDVPFATDDAGATDGVDPGYAGPMPADQDTGGYDWTATVGDDFSWTADPDPYADVEPTPVDDLPFEGPIEPPGPIDVVVSEPETPVSVPTADIPSDAEEPPVVEDTAASTHADESVAEEQPAEDPVVDPDAIAEGAKPVGPIDEIPIDEPVIDGSRSDMAPVDQVPGEESSIHTPRSDEPGAVGPQPMVTDGAAVGEPADRETAEPERVESQPGVAVTTHAPVFATPMHTDHREAGVGNAGLFGAWGAMLTRAFGVPGGALDAAAGGEQPATGRPRTRLPFRPVG